MCLPGGHIGSIRCIFVMKYECSGKARLVNITGLAAIVHLPADRAVSCTSQVC